MDKSIPITKFIKNRANQKIPPVIQPFLTGFESSLRENSGYCSKIFSVILFPFFVCYCNKTKNHQIYGGRGVHKSISQDSIGLSEKPYFITNGSPTCNRSGINNDTNTRKHGFNDVLYSHRTYWACDSPKPYGPP